MNNIRKYDYRRKLPHIQKDASPVFVTFVTWKRWILPVAVRSLVLDCCVQQHGRVCELHAVVVMPDHVHLILSPRHTETGDLPSLPEIMRFIKGSSARKINKHLQRSGRVWQEESFDHILRSNESLSEKVEYLLNNPVRSGLAATAPEYPWHWQGTIPVL
ncbi:MAG: transposase [Candidatus Korobacteraceae bacterium]